MTEIFEAEGERRTQQAAVLDEDIAQYPQIAGSNPARPTSDEEAPIKGAEYKHSEATGHILQPGCLICGQTIPEKAAKSRAKVCSDPCRYAYRKWRKMSSAERAAAPALRCEVCRGEIPFRPNVLWAEVCSTPCRNAMRRYRFQVLQNQKCPHCYHPSTPAEWEEFRAWRASRGPMQQFFRDAHGRGNLAAQREKHLREALAEAVAVLDGEMGRFLVECSTRKMEGLSPSEVIALGEADGARIAEMHTRLEKFKMLLAKPRKQTEAA